MSWRAISVSPVARHVNQRTPNPRSISKLASYDVASNICQEARNICRAHARRINQRIPNARFLLKGIL
jgi:hypothetical protein